MLINKIIFRFSQTTLTLGYWSGPGQVQPSRYLLELAGAKYTEVRYNNLADWFGRDKFALGLNFPNLPYLIDGDFKLTESETIFDYLIDKYGKTGLLGKGNDKYIVDSLRKLISDISFNTYLYTLIIYEQEKAKFLNDQILAKLNFIKTFVGKKEFLVGYFTEADLYLLNAVIGIKQRFPQSYSPYEEVFDPILARISGIPKIAEYLASDHNPPYPK